MRQREREREKTGGEDVAVDVGPVADAVRLLLLLRLVVVVVGCYSWR